MREAKAEGVLGKKSISYGTRRSSLRTMLIMVFAARRIPPVFVVFYADRVCSAMRAFNEIRGGIRIKRQPYFPNEL